MGLSDSKAAGGWAAWPREDLAPCRAWMAERMREKADDTLATKVWCSMDGPTSIPVIY